MMTHCLLCQAGRALSAAPVLRWTVSSPRESHPSVTSDLCIDCMLLCVRLAQHPSVIAYVCVKVLTMIACYRVTWDRPGMPVSLLTRAEARCPQLLWICSRSSAPRHRELGALWYLNVSVQIFELFTVEEHSDVGLALSLLCYIRVYCHDGSKIHSWIY